MKKNHLAVAFTLVAVLALAGCAATPAHSVALPTAHATQTPTPTPVKVVTFSSAGDSISALVDGNGKPSIWSWVPLAAGPDLKDVGGYKHVRATTIEIMHNVTPIQADVSVVLAGTNDISWDMPTSMTLANISTIFAELGGTHKLLSAVPPRDADHAAQTVALNVALRAYAKAHGWAFVDPWVWDRNADGTWRQGTNWDSKHPSAETGALVAIIMRAAILKAARSS